MKTLTYNPDSNKWVESDDGLDPVTLPAEWHWNILRRTRNRLLRETDWMANSDVTMTDEWKNYRKSLRDLPANTSDPSKPTYPTKPN